MDTFDSKDEFYRVIKRSQPSVICEDGTISSALFKNENAQGNPGISVDCQDGRQREEVIAFMKDCFTPRLKGLLRLPMAVLLGKKQSFLGLPLWEIPFMQGCTRMKKRGPSAAYRHIGLQKNASGVILMKPLGGHNK